MKVSPLKYKWIGVRVEKLGRAKKLLLKQGFFSKISHADLNNRNGFDFVKPNGQNGLENLDIERLAKAGLVGIAMEFTDLQWKHNAAITDRQWQKRKLIECS